MDDNERTNCPECDNGMLDKGTQSGIWECGDCGAMYEGIKNIKKVRCPALLEKGMCFAGNLDPSCEECKKQYEEGKLKKKLGLKDKEVK